MVTKTIRFKSTPENWKKEYSGLKCNTVRIFSDRSDVRLEVLRDYIDGILNLLNVEIVNSETEEEFTRSVTDITKFDGSFIISWKANN